MEKARWLIHGKGTPTNYHEARKILESLESNKSFTCNNVWKEMKSILLFSETIDDTQNISNQLRQSQQFESEVFTANENIFSIETQKTTRKKVFKQSLIYPLVRLNEFIYCLKEENNFHKLFDICKEIVIMAENNYSEAIEYLVEWLLDTTNKKRIKFIYFTFLKVKNLKSEKSQKITLQTLQLYFIMKGVSLMNKYCIEQLTKFLLKYSQSNGNEIKNENINENQQQLFV